MDQIKFGKVAVQLAVRFGLELAHLLLAGNDTVPTAVQRAGDTRSTECPSAGCDLPTMLGDSRINCAISPTICMRSDRDQKIASVYIVRRRFDAEKRLF